MTGPARGLTAALIMTSLMALTTTGCTRRQLIPGIVAGVGAVMLTSGAIYRATLDTDEPFGETDGQIAGTTILLFGGAGALLTGVILSLTMADCESNDDCWASDVCERRSRTCISREAAEALSRPIVDEQEEGNSGANDSTDEPEPEEADDAATDEDSDPEEEEEEERPPYPY